MLSHERIWAAIDRLAEQNDLTASGLAKRAGLDATTFNKSKRFSADGRARWPSTESLAKIVEATNSSLDDFMAMVSQGDAAAEKLPLRYAQDEMDGALNLADVAGRFKAKTLATIPIMGMAQAGSGGFFDDAGFPVGEGWERVPLPGSDDMSEHAYALRVTGESMLPLYRPGDLIIVSPTASLRVGDRVVAKIHSGEVMAKVLKKRNSKSVILESVNREHDDLVFVPDQIDWLARIVWASQ